MMMKIFEITTHPHPPTKNKKKKMAFVMTMMKMMIMVSTTTTMTKMSRSVGICILELAEGKPPLSHLHPMRALMQVSIPLTCLSYASMRGWHRQM